MYRQAHASGQITRLTTLPKLWPIEVLQAKYLPRTKPKSRNEIVSISRNKKETKVDVVYNPLTKNVKVLTLGIKTDIRKPLAVKNAILLLKHIEFESKLAGAKTITTDWTIISPRPAQKAGYTLLSQKGEGEARRYKYGKSLGFILPDVKTLKRQIPKG